MLGLGRRLVDLDGVRDPARVGRAAAGHELAVGLAQRRVLDVQVAVCRRVRRLVGGEADLVDGRPRTGQEQAHLQHADDVRLRQEGLVDLEVVAEDARELLALADVQQRAHAVLVDDLAQEVLLARGAEEVAVAVAVADVVERVLALELLIARLDVDRRELLARTRRRVVVVVAAVDVDVDASDVVDRAPEAAEVDVDDVVDREVLARRVQEEPLDRGDGLARPADLVGGVDLVGAGSRDLHLQVARHRHHGDPLRVRVDAGEQDRVRARLELAPLVPVALVGAEDQERARAAGLRAADLGDLDRGASLLRPDERLDDVVDLQQHRRGDRGGRERDRQRAGEQGAQQHAAPRARRALGRAHARPPCTLRSSGLSGKRSGTLVAKPTSARR